MKLPGVFRSARRWLSGTPERALDRAYRAALTIKAIEDEYFGAQKVAAENSDYSDRVLSYFQTEVDKYVQTARVGLKEFKTSQSFVRLPDRGKTRVVQSDTKYYELELREKPSIIVEKLNFIDEVISKYEEKSKARDCAPRTGEANREDKQAVALIPLEKEAKKREYHNNGFPKQESREAESEVEDVLGKKPMLRDRVRRAEEIDASATSRTSVLPRSLLRTLNRIQREFDFESDAEEEVVSNFRRSRDKTVISLRFLLLLIIIPLLVHNLVKIAINPLIEHSLFPENEIVFINEDLESEALAELQQYQERLRLERLVGIAPNLTDEEINESVREKADELLEEYRDRGSNAIANIFADLLSVVAFAGVIYFSQQDIAVLKSFIDELIYGLSDSAKAFLIILFTDMFVGYHSPHGWEVILEGISRHFGLPDSRQFNFLFIATFPVILDTVMKYWIFRYLNRISPSAVATYRNMNE